MEVCRFPVSGRPLETIPLPPRVRSNSASRTYPSSPSLEDAIEEMEAKDLLLASARSVARSMSLPTSTTSTSSSSAKPGTNKAHRNIRMKGDSSLASTMPILPSPSPSFGCLPLPSIVPLHHHHHHYSPSSSPCSSPSLTISSPSAHSLSPSPGQGLSRSATASPVPGSTSEQPQPHNARKPSDTKKRPRSASTPTGSGGEGSSSAAARSKRKRKTPEQLSLLEKEFETNPMPNKDVREHLSQHLGLTSRQVQIWFQNKRAKIKNNRPGSSTQSPDEVSSPEYSPEMHSPLGLDSPISFSSAPSPLLPPLSFASSSTVSSPSTSLSSSYPAPSSPPASFQQFNTIDSFFEPSYFVDLLLDNNNYNNNSAINNSTLGEDFSFEQPA